MRRAEELQPGGRPGGLPFSSPGADPAVAAEPGTSTRLAPGHHVYHGPDGTWRCYSPGDRFVRLRTTVPLLAELLPVLHGAAALDQVFHGREPEVEPLLAALGRQGLLAQAERARCAPRRGVVRVAGEDNPVGRCVAALLGGEVTVVPGAVDEAAVQAADVVITCAGWLPDAQWQRIDTWCADAGVPWHMSYVEGIRLFLGPFSIPDATASYRDTRGRRLAAASAPDELLAHWAYLDSDAVQPPVPWPGAGAVAVVAGLLVADVLAWLDGDQVPSQDHQVEIDPASLVLDRHPVLPLPALAD